MTDLEGRPLEIVTLPMPEPVMFMGRRLPASHANFHIANDRVLVPTCNDPHDRHVLNRSRDRRHPCRRSGLGTLHCLTQQQPRS